MDCDFIEIGTSNFDTCIQTCNDDTVGICVEPLKMYLNDLPNRPQVKKVNCAISNQDGTIPIYFVHPDDIDQYMPEFSGFKGCNSIGEPHPTVQRVLKERNLLHLVRTLKVPLMSFGKLLQTCDVRSIKFLKIDTEGHDVVILQNMLDCYRDLNLDMESPLWPKTIRFESNILTDSAKVDDIIDQFSGYGYQVKYRNSEDTVLVRPIEPVSLPPQACKILVIAYDLHDDAYSFGTRIQELVAKITELNDHYMTFDIKTIAYKIGLKEASSYFNASKPDIIITQQFANEHGRFISQRLHIPHVCVLHNNYGEIGFCYPSNERPHFVLTWNNSKLITDHKIPSDNYDGALGEKLVNFLRYRVSVCVPCHGKHIYHLSNMLNNLSRFTILPHEVVISISLSEDITVTDVNTVITQLKEDHPELLLRVHLSFSPLTASQNRNLAAADTTGTILLFLDADDSYHPQMIEIIEHTWRKNAPMALYWKFRNISQGEEIFFPPLNVSSIQDIPGDEVYRRFNLDEDPSFRYDKCYHFVHPYIEIINGHAAFAKVAWESHPYPEVVYGEDTFHHRLMSWNYRDRCQWIDAYLSLYHRYRSLN